MQGEVGDVEIEQASSLVGILHHKLIALDAEIQNHDIHQTERIRDQELISHSRRQQRAGRFMSTCMAGALFFLPCRSDDTEMTREISSELPRVFENFKYVRLTK